MKAFTDRLFRLQPGENRLLLVLGLFLMGNALARQVAGIVAVSGFLSEGGANQMLLVMGIDYTLVMVVGALHSLIVDRYNRVRLMLVMTLGFALAFLLLRLLFYFHTPGWLSYCIMYLMVEQQYIFFPMVFWVMANDVCSMAQGKRLFPLISSWSFGGILLGIAVAGAAPSLLARLNLMPEDILYFNVFIYLLAFVLLSTGLREYAAKPVQVTAAASSAETSGARKLVSDTLREGWDFVRGVPSFRYLTLAILALALADTIIEFRFYVVTEAVFNTQYSYQRFFSLYSLTVTLFSLGIQTFVTGRVLQKFNLKDTFAFYPSLVFAGVIAMILIPGASMAVAAMLMVKLVRDTLFESTIKSFQALVPDERRGRVSTFITSYLPGIGTLLACLITGAIVFIGLRLNFAYHLVYLGVALLAGGFSVVFILQMRSTYEASLLNWRLKRRQRSTSSVLNRLDL